MSKTKATLLLPLAGIFFVLISCTSGHEVAMSLATNDWPGYRPMYLAKENNYVNAKDLHLVELTSSSEVLRNFRNGVIDAAALTLDEVLSLREDTYDFKIVLVMDVSHGGDVIIARSDLLTMQDLKGKRVGLETTALGAYVLSRALEKAGMSVKDVDIVPLELSEHERAFIDGDIDAIVTFDPVRNRLLKSGGKIIFDSTQIPGEIVDVLVVRDQFLEKNPRKVQRIIDGWFRAVDQLKMNTDDALKQLAMMNDFTFDEYRAALEGLDIPDRGENKVFLDEHNGELEKSLATLSRLMVENGLLKEGIPTAGLYTDDYLPEGSL